MTRSAKGTREDPGRQIRQKAGLNRGILRSGWGLLARRLEQKAPGRVEKVNPAFTSQRCSACGQVDPKSRESQAVFRCTACGYACHADVNAARNIAAGHAVTARGGDGVCPAREPRTSTAAPNRSSSWNPLALGGEDVKDGARRPACEDGGHCELRPVGTGSAAAVMTTVPATPPGAGSSSDALVT